MTFNKELGHIPFETFNTFLQFHLNQLMDSLIIALDKNIYASNLLGRDNNNIHPVDSSPPSSQENIVHPHTVQSSCHMWSDSGSGTPPGNSLQMFHYDILKLLKTLSFSEVNLPCCLHVFL